MKRKAPCLQHQKACTRWTQCPWKAQPWMDERRISYSCAPCSCQRPGARNHTPHVLLHGTHKERVIKSLKAEKLWKMQKQLQIDVRICQVNNFIDRNLHNKLPASSRHQSALQSVLTCYSALSQKDQRVQSFSSILLHLSTVRAFQASHGYPVKWAFNADSSPGAKKGSGHLGEV